MSIHDKFKSCGNNIRTKTVASIIDTVFQVNGFQSELKDLEFGENICVPESNTILIATKFGKIII